MVSERILLPRGGALVASTAVIEGEVSLADGVNVWWHAVLRGDDAPLAVGERTNLQDLVMVHPDPGAPMTIGRDVTVGHHAVLHGVHVGDRCLIGIGAILLSGTVIGDEAVVAAGAVVLENTEVPARTLVAGVPAGEVRTLDERVREEALFRAEKYWREARARAGGEG